MNKLLIILLASTSLTEFAFGETTENVNHYDCGEYGNMIVDFGKSLVSFQGLNLELIESQEDEYFAELDSLGVEAQLTLDGVSSGHAYSINKAISFLFVTKQVDENKVTARDEVIEGYCGLRKQYRTDLSLSEPFQLYIWEDYAYFDCKISFETEIFGRLGAVIRGEHIRTVVTHRETRDYYIRNDEPRETHSRLKFTLPSDETFGPNTKFGLSGSFTIDTHLDYDIDNLSDSEKYEYLSDTLGIRKEIFIDKQSGDLKGLYIDEALGFIQEYSEFNGACQEILAPVLCEESCSYVEESGYRYPM